MCAPNNQKAPIKDSFCSKKNNTVRLRYSSKVNKSHQQISSLGFQSRKALKVMAFYDKNLHLVRRNFLNLQL